jgi:hypothetical protein
VVITVLEVVPPGPPKLWDMARRVVQFDTELPPIELVADVVDLDDVVGRHPALSHVLPCRGSGLEGDGTVWYLDERPPDEAAGALLIGCERSAQFFRWYYGAEPRRVDICPKQRPLGAGPVLRKCCLLERGIEVDGSVVTVPWGAELAEVQEALHLLVGPAASAEPDARASTTAVSQG